MPLDPDVVAHFEAVARAGGRPLHESPPEESRAAARRFADAFFGPKDEVGTVDDRAIGRGVTVRTYTPPSDDAGGDPWPVLVYFHGGGWVVGDLDVYDGVCRALCARTPCAVVSVDYRLAPEHRFPAAVDDVWAATLWVVEHAAELGLDSDRIAVGGDSAGGNLAAVVARRARDAGVPIAYQLLVYPVLDDDLGRTSHIENANAYGLSRAGVHWGFDNYLGPSADRSDPDALPLKARNVAGLAPAFVLTVEYDPLRDDGRAYAERLRDAGVPVTYVEIEGLCHGVFRLPARIPRAWELYDHAVSALRTAFEAGAPAS